MERIVHGAPCAVLVAPAGYADREHGRPRRIGVGFADTPEGREAIALARDLAERVHGTVRIIAASGLSPAPAPYSVSSASLPGIEQELDADLQADVRRVLSDALDGDAEQSGVELEIERGDPSRVLADASRSLDLLVLGSRAYGPLRHALLGSVSADVMRSARCPTVVLPRGCGRPEGGVLHSEQTTAPA
jgi:nucleotide-binding universal stress UspA family protein